MDKLFNLSAAVALLPTTTDMLADSCALFESLVPIKDVKPGTLLAAVKAGEISAITVQVDDVPFYVIFYHINGDTLHINGAQRIGDGTIETNSLFKAGEMLAVANKCNSIRFLTLHRSLVKLAFVRGYELEAVSLSKKL